MKNFLIYFVIYLILMFLYGSGLVIFDKSRAMKRMRRIPEKALLWVGLLGGAGGEYITMKVIHHKTRVRKFMVLLPACIVLHVILLGVVIYFAFAK